MIKVVIADDENRICRLIQALVNWDKLGMQVVSTAFNGLEALRAVEKEKPDVLITDIRMPGYSGLELISRAKKLNPKLHIIIISGYAHFEYARQAIQYGVNEYLLKPIKKTALTDALEKIKIEIQDDYRAGMDLKGIEKDHKKDVTKLRSVFIQDLLNRPNMICSGKTLREQYHFMVQPGQFQAFCMKIDYKNGRPNPEAVSVITNKFIDTVVNRLKKYCYDYVIKNNNYMVYGIMNYAPKESENIRKILRDSLNQMDVQKGFMIGTAEISMGLGIAVHSSEEISKSFDTAIVAVEERLILGTGKLLDGFEKEPVLFEEKLLERYARNIGYALETLNRDAMEKEVDGLYHAVRENSRAHGWEILELVNSAASLFVMILDIKDKPEYLKAFRKACENCSKTEALFDSLKNFEKNFMDKIFAERESNSIRPVRLAQQYIQNHYQEPISLEEVSEKVGLSAAYFSVLFKREAGTGFAKYLMNVRMNEAKGLLRETNLPVSEICQRVGYHDIRYFTNTFKKIAGVKPVLFRKLYG